MARASWRLPTLIAAVAVIALGALLGGRALWRAAQDHFSDPHCTIGEYQLDTEQAAVASTMVGEVAKFRPALPDRAAVLVLAAGLQESKLRNLAQYDGDRDSVGVLQQRPSQGWGGGNAAKLNDVTEATREFLAALVRVKHWQRLPLADAIQAVQVSADGSAYAQHADEATALAAVLQGRPPAAISCTFDKPTKVATAATVINRLKHELPVPTATAAGSSINVPGAGWQTTAWFVANADRLGVDAVAYNGRRWSRAGGWVDSPAPKTVVVATMAKR